MDDPRSSLRIASCTVKAALRFVKRHHRHLPDLQGGLFAARVVDEDGRTRGVGIAANPPPAWQGTGRLVIARVATDGCPNACSALYGEISRRRSGSRRSRATRSGSPSTRPAA